MKRSILWVGMICVALVGCEQPTSDSSPVAETKPATEADPATPAVPSIEAQASTKADETPESEEAEEAKSAPKEADAAAAPQADADGWYSLFNGKDLSGWKLSEDNPATFKVVDGEIVVKGSVAHLYYDGPLNNHEFKNFAFKCEILTKPHANSGMYFHTKWQPNEFPHQGLEIQVNNTHTDPRKTGSIYRANDIMNDSPAKDDEWFTQEVIVEGRHIIVKVNDKVVNDHTEPEHPEREVGWENNIVGSGTFALQGHDPDSEVHYRKVMVKPLPN